MEEKKQRFISCYNDARGIIAAACQMAGISRSTYYKWKREDSEFAALCDEVGETQKDYVENALLKNIENGNVTAQIFYLKTKAKERGWSERPQPQEPQPQPMALPSPEETKAVRIAAEKRVKDKKQYIVRLLKKEGKYTAELSLQVTITAQLWARTDMLADEIFSASHKAVNVEISREGNERESISPKERLYLDYSSQLQRSLRALGMNIDAKERKPDTDGVNEFLNAFKDDDE